VNYFDQVQFFWFLKGRCHGNQFSCKNGAKSPTHPALIILSIRNGMGYRYLNVCFNSPNNASISCKNFVNCGPVTSEKTGLICVLFTTWQKTGIFSQISQDILDRFLQYFHHTKALWVQTIELYLVFQYVKGCCMAINWFW